MGNESSSCNFDVTSTPWKLNVPMLCQRRLLLQIVLHRHIHIYYVLGLLLSKHVCIYCRIKFGIYFISCTWMHMKNQIHHRSNLHHLQQKVRNAVKMHSLCALYIPSMSATCNTFCRTSNFFYSFEIFFRVIMLVGR